MSAKRYARLYIGGKVSEGFLSRLADKITQSDPALLDGYWNAWSGVITGRLIDYAKEDRWVEVRTDEARDGVIGLEDWLQEERVPFDKHMPPFGDLPGVCTYYRPPETLIERHCDFFGNSLLYWEDVRKVLTTYRLKRLKQAREQLEKLLGPDIEELTRFELVAS